MTNDSTKGTNGGCCGESAAKPASSSGCCSGEAKDSKKDTKNSGCCS